MRSIRPILIALALTAFTLSAVITTPAHAQLHPGDILVNNPGGNVQQYSPAGILLNTFTGTGDFYEGAGVTPDGSVVTTRRSAIGFNIYNPSSGTEIASFDTPAVILPGDVSVFADGILAINDQAGKAVRLYDQSGNLIRSLTGGLDNPFGNTISPLDNTLYVASFSNATIVHFDEAGNSLGSFGVGGFHPDDLVVDPTDGSLWVAHSSPATVVHFSPTGATLGSFGIGMLGAFGGIGISPDGSTLYATTAVGPTINRFDRSGNLLGSFSLAVPTGTLFLTVVPGTVGVSAAPEPSVASLLIYGLFVGVGKARKGRRI